MFLLPASRPTDVVAQMFTLRGDGLLFVDSLYISGEANITNGEFGSLEITTGGMTVETGGLVVSVAPR